jgi:hypothetical protein
VVIPKGIKVRRLHKAFLRYHDPDNWPVLRDALKRMGRADLIGNGRHHLIPAYQPVGSSAGATSLQRPAPTLPFRTQHTGLPKSGRGHGGKPGRGSGPGSRSNPGSRNGTAGSRMGTRRGRP